MKGKILVTRKFPGNAISMLQSAGFKVEVFNRSDMAMPRKDMLKKIKGCLGAITLLTDKVNAEFFEAAGKQLKVVANYAVGFDNIDVVEATKRGIKVGNTPCEEVNEAVAEAAMAMILASATQIVAADKFTRAGKYRTWDPAIFVGPSLVGKTLGIIGLGRIGSGLANRAKDGFGMKIVYSDIKRNPKFQKAFKAKYLSLDQLLKTADFVSLHVPLFPSTRHMISTKQFNLMKKTAYLINTARGPVVDEWALIQALKANKIAGVALDVYECEPQLDCNPFDNNSLLSLGDKVIFTPHTASATIEARNKMAELAALNVINALNGKKMPAQVLAH